MLSRPNLAGCLWYDITYWSSFTFFTFGFSYRRDGWRNIPKTGPLLLLANHQSMFDPVLVGLASRRYLSYLARKTLFDQPVLAPLIRSLNAIPIDRGFGKDGIQAVLDALSKGRAVLMFPEGERTHTGAVQPLKPGVSLLIKRLSCPVVPVGIAGAFAAWGRHWKVPRPSPLLTYPGPSTIAVSVGEPIDPVRYKGMDRDDMMSELQTVLIEQFQAAEKLKGKD
jgi:1-acyl-sn-glycerol-3-phosphate acyltransferase